MGNLPQLSDLELIDYIVTHVLQTGGDGLIHKDHVRRLLELAGEAVPPELENQDFWQLVPNVLARTADHARWRVIRGTTS